MARFLPRGYALHRGLKLQRAIMNMMGNAGRIRTVPVAAVNEHVSVRLHRPAGLADHAPALLWIHGGGTIMGHAAQDDKYLRQLSQLTGVAIAAVEHRLAPEHPYPIPVEDCYAACSGWRASHGWTGSSRCRRRQRRRAFRRRGGAAGARPPGRQNRFPNAGISDARRSHRRPA